MVSMTKEELIQKIEEILICLTEEQLEVVYWIVRRMASRER